MCGDRLRSVEDEILSSTTGLGEEDLVLFFLGDIRAYSIQYMYL